MAFVPFSKEDHSLAPPCLLPLHYFCISSRQRNYCVLIDFSMHLPAAEGQGVCPIWWCENDLIWSCQPQFDLRLGQESLIAEGGVMPQWACEQGLLMRLRALPLQHRAFARVLFIVAPPCVARPADVVARCFDLPAS